MTKAPNLLKSFKRVHCSESIKPTSSLIHVKSFPPGCQRAVGAAADEAVPTFPVLWRAVLPVSVIYTPPITLTQRGICGHTCVPLCIYSSWWLMQGKSRWVKTTSVRWSVCEAIIYSLWTKLPSNFCQNIPTGNLKFDLTTPYWRSGGLKRHSKEDRRTLLTYSLCLT